MVSTIIRYKVFIFLFVFFSRTKFFESKMMKTNLKCQSILMGSNPRICKSESKTILSVFQPNMRRKQANQTAKVILPDNYRKALAYPKAVKWTRFHHICQKTVFWLFRHPNLTQMVKAHLGKFKSKLGL